MRVTGLKKGGSRQGSSERGKSERDEEAHHFNLYQKANEKREYWGTG